MSETPHDITSPEITHPPISLKTPPGPLDLGPLINDSGDDDDDYFPLPPSLAKRRRRRPWWVWLIVGLVIVLMATGGLIYLRQPKGTPVTYTQGSVTSGNLSVTVSGSGPVEPSATYSLSFATTAPLTEIDVKVGDRVKKGQKLAKVDPTTLQDAVNTAKANVTTAETNLSQAQTNLGNVENQQSTSLDIAQINEQKALAACTSTSSSGSGGSSPTATATPTPSPTPNATATATAVSQCQQLAKDQYSQSQQQSNASITNASNQVTSAQNQLTSAQNALKTAQDNLKNATLYAPANGRIEVINGLIGENPGSSSSSSSGNGSSGSSAFITMIDDSSLSIQASVSEADIANVQDGQAASFTVAAYPSQTFTASVASVNTIGVTSSSVVSYTVDLAVDMQSLNDAHVYPGMTATASITTDQRIGALLVPSGALTFYTTALQNGEITRSQITALTSSASSSTTGTRGIITELKDGKLVLVLVTIGLTNGTQTEILSGLQEGDQMVVSQTGGTTTTSSSSSSSGNGNSRFNGGGGGGGGFGGLGGGFILNPGQ